MTEDKDPLIWLTNEARRVFSERVAKARFRPLHDRYVEQEWNGVMTHVICALHGMDPDYADVVDCIHSKWTLTRINDDLRGMKEAQQAAANPSPATSGPTVYRDHFKPPRLVFGSRGAVGGMR